MCINQSIDILNINKLSNIHRVLDLLLGVSTLKFLLNLVLINILALRSSHKPVNLLKQLFPHLLNTLLSKISWSFGRTYPALAPDFHSWARIILLNWFFSNLCYVDEFVVLELGGGEVGLGFVDWVVGKVGLVAHLELYYVLGD